METNYGLFLNISNTSVFDWKGEQRDTALKLGYFQDFKFPNVPADASTDEVGVIAEKLFREILVIKERQKISCIHIMGEVGLLYRMLWLLGSLEREIIIIHSTFKIITKMRAMGKKYMVEEFVQFRKYR